MRPQELADVLERHREWLDNGLGEKADLRDANLYGADLSCADLRGLRNAKRFLIGRK